MLVCLLYCAGNVIPWAKVAQSFPNRTDTKCKIRWRIITPGEEVAKYQKAVKIKKKIRVSGCKDTDVLQLPVSCRAQHHARVWHNLTPTPCHPESITTTRVTHPEHTIACCGTLLPPLLQDFVNDDMVPDEDSKATDSTPQTRTNSGNDIALGEIQVDLEMGPLLTLWPSSVLPFDVRG